MLLLFKPVGGSKISNSDFKNHYSGVNANLEFDEIKPAIRQATSIFIVPYIGTPLYSVLASYFDDGTTSNAYKNQLIEYLKDSIANYAVHLALPEKVAILAASGVRNASDDKSQNTPQWSFKNKVLQALLNGDKFLDMALDYIQKNAAQFSEFLPREGGERMFASSDILEQYLNISGFRAYTVMQKYLRKAKEDFLLPIVGNATYEAITLVSNELNDQGLNLFRKYTAEAAFLNAIPNIALINDGDSLRVVSKSDNFDSRESLKSKEHFNLIETLSKRTEANVAEYRRQLVQFLYDNKDTYTNWQTTNYYLNNVADTTSATTVRANDYGAVSIG